MIEVKSQVDLNPQELAALFANMDADQQAEFYNELGAIAMNWRGTGLCTQMCYVRDSDKLNATGRATMAKIGEWGKE